jgi:hypothetical protein
MWSLLDHCYASGLCAADRPALERLAELIGIRTLSASAHGVVTCHRQGEPVASSPFLKADAA